MRCHFHAQSSEFAQDVGGNDGALPPEIRRVYNNYSLYTKLSVSLGNLAGEIDL